MSAIIVCGSFYCLLGSEQYKYGSWVGMQGWVGERGRYGRLTGVFSWLESRHTDSSIVVSAGGRGKVIYVVLLMLMKNGDIYIYMHYTKTQTLIHMHYARTHYYSKTLNVASETGWLRKNQKRSKSDDWERKKKSKSFGKFVYIIVLLNNAHHNLATALPARR